MNGWKEFCLFILERCIILPIECSDLDSALTIFGTLNNRGLPLADSDIFKAELYKTQPSKQTFADKWKELEATISGAGFNLNDLFRYYTFIDRAKRGDTSKEIGLRSYYSGKGNKYPIFKTQSFLMTYVIWVPFGLLYIQTMAVSAKKKPLNIFNVYWLILMNTGNTLYLFLS